ncbi:Dynein light chain, cytoplasmic [Camellia lanceoleosa]|uniref:Dynein light chain, cytoplasmic n=1 Tax=Camellia lanceoleosa TaxID=1840588 RepID=A0ACC0IFZ1_9ERIC|nr:Dynein light chain, cytoplasmic [Camellia lanceoleosa]
MEPQKKGLMYVYKLAQNPEVNSPPATMKKAASRNHWGLRRSKTYRENEGGGRRMVLVEEEGGGEVVVEARKSVFSIEGRKSVSHVENNVAAAAAAAAFLQVKVLVTEMPGLMQVQAFRCARRTYDSLEKFSSKHIAYHLKKEFDEVYGPAWHCIVGSSFGSFVTHSTGCFLYFSMEKFHILLFQTKVQRALN